MKLSVLVPSFNSSTFIKETLESVLPALREDDEVVIQDGGSTDSTLAVLETNFASDERVRVVSERDEGQSQALNRALDRATGDLILWLNADDVVFPDTLTRARALFDKDQGLELCTAGHKVLKADGEVLGSYRGRPLVHELVMRRGCYVFSGSFLVRREKLLALGGFREDLHFTMDLDLMFRLCTINPTARAVVPEPLGALRRHDESKSGTSAGKFVREGWRVRRAYARGIRDQLRRITIAIEQPVVSAAKPIRFSRPYRVLRDSLWRRHG